MPWYALYTRPRAEKKVHELLTKKGYESYCPLNKVRKRWSDRMKTTYQPLFRSYVFINTSEQQISIARRIPGIVSPVMVEGRPAVIPNAEIEMIKRFLNDYERVEAVPIQISVNQIVKITGGALLEATGNVLAVSGRQVKVLIKSLGYELIAWVEKNQVDINQG
jgi:transcription antitermination factor NusG